MERTPHLEEIFSHWESIRIVSWKPIQDNVVQITGAGGQQYVLKNLGQINDKLLNRIQFEYDVLRHVEMRGVPVGIPLLTSEGDPYLIDGDSVFRLTKWLTNQPSAIQTKKQQVQIYQNYGTAIGRFHQALATYEDSEITNRTWQTDLHERILDEAIPLILARLNPSQKASFLKSLTVIQSEMGEAFAALPIQLIIWDCHPGNVAVDGLQVSGFIDCDHLSLAPRIFDLANFLVHLIKWDVRDEEKTNAWLASFHHLIDGYEQVVPLTREEKTAIFYLLAGIPLIFIEFFARQGLQSSIEVELNIFRWLIQHQKEITEQLLGRGRIHNSSP